MLRFSASQQLALGERAFELFVQGLNERIKTQWPAEGEAMGSERLQHAVRTAVADALAAGYDTELDVSRYVHLVFAFRSVHFHREPWASPIVDDANLPPRVRMNQLFSAACTELGARGGSP